MQQPLAFLLLVVCLFLSFHGSTSSGAGAGTSIDFSIAHSPTPAAGSNFLSCLVSNGVSNFSLPTYPSYAVLLNSSIFNLRFTLRNVTRPAAIVFLGSRDDIQQAILCAWGSSLAIRTWSAGHSYEGLSYTTENQVPFVVVYMANLDRVRVNLSSATAWAESGATVGELY